MTSALFRTSSPGLSPSGGGEMAGAAQTGASDTLWRVLREAMVALQNRWLIEVGALTAGTIGLVLAISANEAMRKVVHEHGGLLGLALLTAAATALLVLSRQE